MTPRRITFSVPGQPVGASRPKFDGRRKRTYYPDAHKKWESKAVGWGRLAWGEKPIAAPVGVRITAILERPKTVRQRKSALRSRILAPVKPDADNIAKLCLDACVKAGIIADDNLVCELTVTTHYGWIGDHVPVKGPAEWEQPHTEISVWELT